MRFISQIFSSIRTYDDAGTAVADLAALQGVGGDVVMRHIEQLTRMIGPMSWLLLGSASILALCYVTLMGCLIG